MVYVSPNKKNKTILEAEMVSRNTRMPIFPSSFQLTREKSQQTVVTKTIGLDVRHKFGDNGTS